MEAAVLEFRLDPTSGLPTYLQLIRQVRQALRLGVLGPGDQLPTAKEVVGSLAINPNTVLKAYRELERAGLIVARPGVGTFVRDSPASTPAAVPAQLRRRLLQWLREARQLGLDEESIEALWDAARDE